MISSDDRVRRTPERDELELYATTLSDTLNSMAGCKRPPIELAKLGHQ